MVKSSESNIPKSDELSESDVKPRNLEDPPPLILTYYHKQRAKAKASHVDGAICCTAI